MKIKDTKDSKDPKGTGASVLGILAVLAVLSSTPLAAQQAPGFGEVVEVNVVNIDAYVTDKAGKPVAGLGKADFEVFEDGKRVEITNFEVVDRSPGAPATDSPGAPAPQTAGEAAAVPAAEAGLHLVVYVDNFNIRHGNRERAIQQLREFLTRQLVPGDKVMIASNDLGGMNVQLPFSSDSAALSAALGRLETLSVQGDEDDRARREAFQQILAIQNLALQKRSTDPPCPLQIASPAHGYAAVKRQEVLRTLSSLTLLVNSLSGVPGRKAVLYVSDGITLTPGAELFELLFQMCGGGAVTSGMGSAPSEGTPVEPSTILFDSRFLGPDSYQAASQAQLDAQTYNVAGDVDRLAAHANAHRVTLYTLEASGAQVSAAADASFGPTERMLQFPSIARVQKANRQDSLQALASATGGRAFFDSINFLPELALMRQDFDRYYSLGYTPAHVGDGKEHRIEVKVKRPGLRVRSRQSYRDKPALERTVDRTLAALLYNVEDNPLEVTLEIGEPAAEAKGGRYIVPVNLRIPLFKLGILNDQEKYKGRLRIFVATRGEKGMTPIRQLEVPFEIPREQVMFAMGQYYGYTLSLQMTPGEQQVAVAVRDETTTTTSYLSRAVNVGAVATASQNR
ncbi:MAG TPA: VWA domain-containing protein [Thermoanaerobaculia bacterium]|nr:VWA domain-containing protein [Thermoanaerobaculia bacterium]